MSGAEMLAAIATLLGGTGVGSLLTYLGARRRASGKVATTEADQLWAEAGRLRAAMEEQIERLTERVTRQEDQIAAMRFADLQKEEEIRRVTSENARLTVRVNELERELFALRARAAEEEGER